MERNAQLEFLKQKFVELSEQYLHALREGSSLQQIRDLSYVLDCLKKDIQVIESGNISDGKHGASIAADKAGKGGGRVQFTGVELPLQDSRLSL